MPRTEKRFGVVNQPSLTAVEELVPSAATTRNVLINASARSAAVISAAIYSGAYSAPSTSVALSPGSSSINMANGSTIAGGNQPTALWRFGKGSSWNNTFAWGSASDTSGFVAVNQSTGSAMYTTQTFAAHTGDNYWRNVFDREVQFKGANSGAGIDRPKLNNCYVAVSDTKAIGIAANMATTASGDLFDVSTISHTVGTSFTETAGGVGQTSLQGVGAAGTHTAAAYALQDGVGYLMHSGTDQVYTNTSGRVGLGIYIYSDSSASFDKRAFWNCDGTVGKESGYALAYFVASDYNSTHGVFAFSQPSTTTLWSNISPTSSTSFPAAYALPADAAPAGFRIVSNSNTVAPTDTNFLTGAITYPAAPTGVDVPVRSLTRVFQVAAVKFSPDGERVAVAYSRNYSGTGNTNSVVVVYTRQNDGTWLHTASSGSALRYMPDSPDCMAWSPDGGVIAIAASSSTGTITLASTESYFIDLWAVGEIGAINNSAVTSWTVASSKYPDLPQYIAPKSGTSTVGSVTINANVITGGSPSSSYTIRSVAPFTTTTGAPPTVVATIGGTVLTSAFRQLQGYVMQGAGTVGTTGVPAVNYVTSVVNDLSLTQGQTTQVSNIVLGSGERLYVGSSTSDSVDISAHGIEST
jgi:hypothetical protein